MDSLEQQCIQKRNDILAYCKRLADDGAHYLWGAAGDKPSTNGAVQYAPVVLDPNQPAQTCFRAATITVTISPWYTCAPAVSATVISQPQTRPENPLPLHRSGHQMRTP